MTRSSLSPAEIDRRRRAFLVRALSLGLLAGGAGWNASALAAIFGRQPYQLPPGKSIFELRGAVTADGKPVSETTVLSGSERIVVPSGGHLIAVVGQEAFILRENSTLEMKATRAAKGLFRLVSGAMLTVFGKRSEADSVLMATPTATLGIRGTGVYVEAEANRSYVCVCYGHTEFAPTADPQQKEQAVSKHHDAPKYVLGKAEGGKLIVPAPFKNHTDLELMALEALVGRTVPFGAPGDEYEAPRRDEY